MANTDEFIKALVKGTKNNEIKWSEIDKKYNNGFFTEPGERVENAYYYSRENKVNIIIYKGSTFLTNSFGEDIEQMNVNFVITLGDSFTSKYKMSDNELKKDFEIWTLYKLIQRQVSNADSIMDQVIQDFLDPFEE